LEVSANATSESFRRSAIVLDVDSKDYCYKLILDPSLNFLISKNSTYKLVFRCCEILNSSLFSFHVRIRSVICNMGFFFPTALDNKDAQLFIKYNVVFRKFLEPVPKSHRRTLKQIAKLGQYKFSRYCRDKPTEPNPSRQTTIHRAVGLANAARNVASSEPSELQWRLEIENLVYGRFSLAIEWYVASCRLWSFCG
jgi:hypothetical protein